MKPLTIKEMAAIMNNAVKLGYGDYALLVSDDEEANGFHPLFKAYLSPAEDDVTYINEQKEEKYLNALTIE